VNLFDEVRPATVAWLRVMSAAICWWPSAGAAGAPGLDRARSCTSAALFGIATAVMNLFFYLAIDRHADLGKSVVIEFIGPIAVAAAFTRSARNSAALVLAARRGGDALRRGDQR
jgi:inner membrane transporter RhtA